MTFHRLKYDILGFSKYKLSFLTNRNILRNIYRRYRLKGIYFYLANFMRVRYGKRKYGCSNFMFKKLHLEVTTSCNMHCKRCSRAIIEKKIEHMSLKNFKTIVDKIPGLSIAQITGLGETLLNPDILKQVEYLKSKHIYTGLSTNGAGLREQTSRGLLESGLDWIDISLPSVDPHIYKKIRGVDAISEGLLNKIAGFQSLNKLNFNARTKVYILIVYSKENEGSLFDVLDFICSAKIDNVIIKFAEDWNPHNKYLQIDKTIPKEIDMTKSSKEVKYFLKESKSRGLKCAIKCQMKDSEYRKIFNDSEKCESAWYHLGVLCNGDVIPCLCTKELHRNYIMGNLIRDDFNEIWNGNEFLTWREKIISRDMPDVCNYCTRDITLLFK